MVAGRQFARRFKALRAESARNTEELVWLREEFVRTINYFEFMVCKLGSAEEELAASQANIAQGADTWREGGSMYLRGVMSIVLQRKQHMTRLLGEAVNTLHLGGQ